MADALDLVHRGTDLWVLVESKAVRASYARFVVAKTRSLPEDQAQFVATAVAQSADGRIPWSRFEALVEAAVAAADPEAAREKEEHARNGTFARKLRNQESGMGSYLVRAPIPVIDRIASTVDAYSAAIAEDFPDLDDDQRAVQAILMLLTPDADQDSTRLADHTPVVNLYVHTYAGPDSTGVARFEGHGPVTEDWVRDVLGPLCRFKIYPVIDLEGMAPVDAYEIPDRHRQAAHLMTPADVFPWGSSLSRTQQVDHTIPHDEGGVSGIGNYGPMTVTHHRIKTHGRWQVQQPFPGIYVWRDAYGATYLVDNTGTRRIRETDALPMVVEIYRNLPETKLDWAA